MKITNSICTALQVVQLTTSLSTAVHLPMQRPNLVGKVLSQIIENYLDTCHLILVTTGNDYSPFPQVFGLLSKEYKAAILIDLQDIYSSGENEDLKTILIDKLQVRHPGFSCYGIFIDAYGEDNNFDNQFRFLDETKAHLKPETKVMFIGTNSDVEIEAALTHKALRNTAHVLYISTARDTAAIKKNHQSELFYNPFLKKNKNMESLQMTNKSSTCLNDVTSLSERKGKKCDMVAISFRCLYCRDGDHSIRPLNSWSPSTGFLKKTHLFPAQFENFHGHTFNIVSMDWFPFLQFTRDSNQSSTTVTPKDSLDYRMLIALSKVLNFTYVMRTPWDNQWGVSQTSGNWTGTVGTLQHNKADFSMLLSWMGSRMAVVDYSRVYVSEPLVIVTAKPRELPEIFSLVRPFPKVLWVAILGTCMIAGTMIWLLQKIWGWMLGKRSLNLSTALLYSWGILLEDPPVNLPSNITARLVLGLWWVFCILITVAYRSSLIAHLSVPGKSATIDTLEQLLQPNGWTWGMEETYGIGWEWFRKSTVPTVMNIYKHMEAKKAEEHLVKVLKGNHAFLTWKYYIQTIIASRYTDARGYTPLYTGRGEYINYGGYGWGFRRGAPFRRSIDDLKLRLMECGLINYWMNDLILTSSRIARQKNVKNMTLLRQQVPEGRVVLGLQHLQGAFYLLGLGCVSASIALLIERIVVRFA